MSAAIAVVTGAAQGIGHATAARLAADGMRVVALDREAAANEAAAAALRQRGLAVEAVAADVTRRETIRTALAGLDRIDLLVNNAGVFWPRAFAEITEADMIRTYEVSVLGAVLATQEALGRMPAGASIVNVASRAYMGAAGYAHYVAAKAAVVGLTRAMALDLAERGIRVNAVAPGVILTPMTRGLGLHPDERGAAPPPVPVGEPETVADSIAFLAGPQGRFVNGQTVVVDGGRSLGLAAF